MSYSKKYHELKVRYENIVERKEYPVHKWLALKDVQDEARALIPEVFDRSIRTDLATLCVECEKQINSLAEKLK